jgi:ferredoxin
MKMNEPVGAETIAFKLNGETISAHAGETIIQAAKRHGVDIPHLCYKEGYRADGNCRACMVEIKGERVLAPSCCRTPAKGMEVESPSQRALHSQKMVLELLMADVPKVASRRRQRAFPLGRRARRTRSRAPARGRGRCVPPGDVGEPDVHPRCAGGEGAASSTVFPRRRVEDRVRLRRPDGQITWWRAGNACGRAPQGARAGEECL